MAMNIEITESFISTLNNAAREWSAEPITATKFKHFDELCKAEYGIDATFSGDRGIVELQTANIIDEEKYIWFLLRFGMK
jgi:hypothetical protein